MQDSWPQYLQGIAGGSGVAEFTRALILALRRLARASWESSRASAARLSGSLMARLHRHRSSFATAASRSSFGTYRSSSVASTSWA